MKKMKFLLIALFSLMFFFTACREKTVTPTESETVEASVYKIDIANVINGTIISSVKEAKEGEKVQVEVKPNIGYKLVADSLKANDAVIQNNEFIMPAKNVSISADFGIDGNAHTPKATNLEISAISSNVTALAHFEVKFEDDKVSINICVEDENLISNDNFENGDAISILFGNRTSKSEYVKDSTFKLNVKVDKTNELLVYDGSDFKKSDSTYKVDLSYFSVENKLGGYLINAEIPYASIGLTKDNAKANLAICPVLYNQNSNSKLISATKAVNEEFNCDPSKLNTYIYVTDDNTFAINPYAYGTYQLGFMGDINENWDLSKDYFPENSEYENRVVVLKGTDEQGNDLTFYKSNASEIYAEATFLLKNVYAGETLGKFGFKMVDKFGNGFMFFMDAHGRNVSSMSTNREAGYVMIRGGEYDWSTHVVLAAAYVPSRNEQVKLAIYRNGEDFDLIFNDTLVASLNNPGGVGTAGIYPTITSFNLGIEVTEYMSTDDKEVFEGLLPAKKTGGYVFKDASDTLRNGVLWDLTNDTEEASGEIVLSGHDGIDNNLFYNMSSTEFMYARASFELTDYLNKGDAWLKFGLALFDGSYKPTCSQYMFYVDAFTGDKNYASSLYHIIGDKFGRALNFANWASYDGSASRFDLTTLKVKMELVYENNKLFFYADGALVGIEEYVPKTTELFIGIKNFGFGLKVNDYYCSTDKTDSKISDYIINEETKATYYFLGSSVTYGSATNGVSFVDLLPDSLDCTVVKNAVSGTTLVDSGSNSYVQRLRQFPKNTTVEHLVVQLSTNDASQKKTLGTVSASGTTVFDTSTIVGAIEDIINYAKNTWNCEVTFYTNPKYNNAEYEAMIDALYDVKEKWNIGILDFYNYQGMTALDSQTLQSYMADSIHPNAKGYEWMKEEFVKYLRASYEANHNGETI